MAGQKMRFWSKKRKKNIKNFGVFKKVSTFALAIGKYPISGSKQCGNSSVGRAQPCQGWGREFESRFPLKMRKTA